MEFSIASCREQRSQVIINLIIVVSGIAINRIRYHRHFTVTVFDLLSLRQLQLFCSFYTMYFIDVLSQHNQSIYALSDD